MFANSYHIRILTYYQYTHVLHWDLADTKFKPVLKKLFPCGQIIEQPCWRIINNFLQITIKENFFWCSIEAILEKPRIIINQSRIKTNAHLKFNCRLLYTIRTNSYKENQNYLHRYCKLLMLICSFFDKRLS